MRRVDHVNMGLLALLQADGRMSLAELARRVGRSETTVRDRLASMQSAGVLRGVHARVDEAALGYHARAVVRARCEDVQEARERLLTLPQVRGAVVTAGDRPLLLDVLERDLPALGRALQELGEAGLEDVVVDPVMGTLVPRRAVPLGGHASLRRAKTQAAPLSAAHA